MDSSKDSDEEIDENLTEEQGLFALGRNGM
jgi:hypothetical protein